VHRDIPQPNQENIRPVPDFLRRQAISDSSLEQRLVQTAEKYKQVAADLVKQEKITSTDELMFHDWLSPNGTLDLGRVTNLAAWDDQTHQQYYQSWGSRTDYQKWIFVMFLKRERIVPQTRIIKIKEPRNESDANESLPSPSAFEEQAIKKLPDSMGAFKETKQERTEFRLRQRSAYYRQQFLDQLTRDPNNNPLG
jgi:hypothetical protein